MGRQRSGGLHSTKNVIKNRASSKKARFPEVSAEAEPNETILINLDESLNRAVYTVLHTMIILDINQISGFGKLKNWMPPWKPFWVSAVRIAGPVDTLPQSIRCMVLILMYNWSMADPTGLLSYTRLTTKKREKIYYAQNVFIHLCHQIKK